MPTRALSRLPAQPFCLSLHIRHPSLEPAQISRELQLDPDEAFGAGERRKGAAAAGVHGETYWVATLDETFWRSTFLMRGSAGAEQPVAAAGSAGRAAGSSPARRPLPADRPSRFKLLINRGRERGYLTEEELHHHLPDEIGNPRDLQGVIKALAELGIPVHARASAAAATIKRLSGFEEAAQRAMRKHLDRNPELYLSGTVDYVCLRLAHQHSAFLKRIREEGGAVRLLVTLSPRAVSGFGVTPELSARLGQLGIHLEVSIAGSARRSRSRA
jgi:hypothetical protein